MSQYLSANGVPTDWQLVHLGQFAMGGGYRLLGGNGGGSAGTPNAPLHRDLYAIATDSIHSLRSFAAITTSFHTEQKKTLESNLDFRQPAALNL